MSGPVLRFAPSPNGFLHLGHAYSALLNEAVARRLGGHWLLRIEDIDPVRSREAYEAAIHADLAWLGLVAQEPARRQSDHMADYHAAFERLRERGLVYPCTCTRGRIASAVAGLESRTGAAWPRDPDGAPLYPGSCRPSADGARPRPDSVRPIAWRLDMAAALAAIGGPITWTAFDRAGAKRRIAADPARWGDPVIRRKDTPTSYHLSVVVDDAIQGITHVVRGQDLEAATDLHALIQALLALPSPRYHHHRLIRDLGGMKLAKSAGSTSLRELRESGVTPDEIRARLDA